MSCPACGLDLDMDPDGGWCERCKSYWDMVDLEEWLAVEEAEYRICVSMEAEE